MQIIQMILKIRTTALIALLCIPSFSVAASEPFDVVIKSGRVMDPETGFDQVADVGIRGGRIVAIASSLSGGREVIDASGHVVAPGFIDPHYHWVRALGYKLALRDGVTTPMDLEFGALGTKVDDWYAMHEGRSQVNYGTGSSHELARIAVLDGIEAMDAPHGLAIGARKGTRWAFDVPNTEEAAAVLGVIDEGLRLGAISVSSTLGYMPGATAREVYAVQSVGAAYDRATTVHTRNTPGTETSEPNGAQEILANAMTLGAPACINHFNNPGWQVVQDLLVNGREQDQRVWGEYYPYAAGSTTLNAQFLRPEIWLEKLGYRYEDTLLDPSTGTFYTSERYQQEVATSPMKLVVVYKMPASEIVNWLRMPGVVMGSDAMPLPGAGFNEPSWDTPFEQLPNLHPRTAGAHAKTLRLARENNISLMHVLAALSYNSAKYLGETGLVAMQERGRIQVGSVADITIFDPLTVTDHATYEAGTRPSTGIPFVLVNGQIVVRDSVVQQDVSPGQPIRFAVEAASRLGPLDQQSWQAAKLIPANGYLPDLDHAH